MKKGIKSLAAAALALSALTPVVASASTSVENGVYTTTNFYTLDQFKALTTAEKTGALTSSGAVVVIGGKVYEATDVLSATDAALPGLAKDAATYTTADGSKLESGKPLAPAPAGELKVESVSAINGSQIEIKFSKPVSKSTVIQGAAGSETITSNITLASVLPTTGLVTPVAGKTSLSADGKTLTITTNALKGNYSVTVDKNVLGTDGTAITAFSQAFSIDEKVAPTVTEVTSTANGATATSVTLKFSEPVQSGAVIKVNGTQVGTTAANATSTTVSGLDLDTTKNHTVEVINLTDVVGNVTALTTKTFTVTQDAAAPVITSVVAQGDTHLLVTFDKKVTTTSVNNSGFSAVDASTNTTITVGSATSVSSATSDTKFLIPISSPASLFTSTNSKTLNVLFTANIQDTLGNKLAPVTKSVTVTKDAVAPKVSTVSYNKAAGTHGSLVINFDEAIDKAGSTAVVSLLNPDGTSNSTLITAQAQAGTLSNDDKTLTIPLAAAPSSTVTGDYTVILSSGFVKDKAATQNNSAAYTGKVNFGAQATKLTVLSAVETASNSNAIKVTFSETVKGGAVAGSATDPANYSLGGKALPEGTLIVLDGGKDFVTITLPAQSVEKSDAAAILTANNVQGTVSGATLTPFTGVVNVADNISPVLQSAKVLNNKQIELTYSEAIGTLSASNVASEFKIYEGTVAKSLGSATLVADNLSGYPTKVIITLGGNASAASVAAPVAVGSVTGTLATPTGTFTGTADETITVEKTAGGFSINGGADVNIPTAYKGLTIAVPAGGAVTGDKWTIAATAAVAATFDVTKAIEVEVIANSVIKDKSALTNAQKLGTRVTATK